MSPIVYDERLVRGNAMWWVLAYSVVVAIAWVALA